MSIKNSRVFILALLLVGCASEPDPVPFNRDLYTGESIETLNLDNKTAPQTEREAIERGDKALNQQNMDLALYEYIRSLALPTGEFRDRTLYTIGRIHQSRGNLELAQKAYLMALDINPNNIPVLEQLGANFSKSGDVVQGENFFLRALNADQLRLGSTQQLLNQPLTPTLISSLVVDGRSPILAYQGLGILHDIKVNHVIAQAFYQQAIKIDPNSQKTLINMGYSYYMSGDYEQAEKITLNALKMVGNNPKVQNNLALIYLAEDRIQKALTTFMTHMDTAEALNNVGYFLILQGKPEKAIPYLQQAIDKKPSYYKIANENLERALAEVRMKKVSE